MVFFVMTSCDSADAPKRMRCPHTDPVLASVSSRKRQKITFFLTRPHPRTASAATATDRLREQIGRARRAQQLHDDSRWNRLPKESRDEGGRLRVPQVRWEVRPAL